jgi:HEAT repeat protein
MPDADERFEYIGREATERLSDMLRVRAQSGTGEALDPDSSVSPDIEEALIDVQALFESEDERLFTRALKLLELGTKFEAAAAMLSRENDAFVLQALRTLHVMLSTHRSGGLRARVAAVLECHAQAMLLRPAGVRCEWIQVLSLVGGSLAYDAGLVAANDSERQVRSKAAGLLGSVGADDALDVLARLLEDEDTSVRHAAAGALGFCNTEKLRAKKVLSAFLKSAKGPPRAAAETSIGRLEAQ